WLPQAHTDAIFAIIGEELGLIGTLLVLGAFLLLAYRGYRIAARSPDPFGALVAVGITSWITLQALLNIAVTTTLVPFTGLTLPFLSYGSSSLIMCMVAAGVLLNISRHASGRRVEQRDENRPALLALLHARLAGLPEWGRQRRRWLWGTMGRQQGARRTGARKQRSRRSSW